MVARSALLILTAGFLLVLQPGAAGSDPEETRQQLVLLASAADLAAKAQACQRLADIGTPEAVPALAALLPHEHLNAYARNALERIGEARAGEALRSATATLTGAPLAGVVTSLGVLRDAAAVPILRRLAADAATGVTREALLALGRIATDESCQFLRQALVDGAEASRADAAAACLLAAETRWAAGETETAVALYDAVRRAQVPPPSRLGATRGAILARGAEGVPLLIEQLRSADPGLRNVALMAIREMPSEALASALNAEVDQGPTELQRLVLLALADCHNAQSLEVLRRTAASPEAEIRRTALALLGTLGGAAEAEVLLRAVAENRADDESAIALGSLRRLAGATVDEQIIRALAALTDARTRILLIRLLEARGASAASGELLRQAAGAETDAAVAALRALKSLAGEADVPALIALMKGSQDAALREAAEAALVGVCLRTGATAAVAETGLTELREATEPATRISWMRVLTSLGQTDALAAIQAALTAANEAVVNSAIEQLGRWPDPAPIEGLFAVVLTSPDPSRRRRALASVVRLATAAADGRQRPEETVVGWLRRADQAAQSTQERLLILSALGRLNHPESLRVLMPHCDDPAVQSEAAVAILQVAGALAPAEPAAVREALDKVVAAVKDNALRERAEKVSATVSRRGASLPLFDGQSLAGWEGNTSIWRVRDGAIVGGSLAGNPHNDFLATTRGFAHFVLCLEYRLVGTEGFVNGGVQFRSVRCAPPSPEVRGYQADIGAGYSGCLYDESRRNQVLARPSDESIRQLETPGEWNRYEVRCLGRRIQLVLNGEKTVDYREADPAIPLEGLIALQIHGDCKAEIAFRNLSIGELSYGLAVREFALPRERWRILSCSSENTEHEDGRAVRAIDGDPGTFWHSQWSGGQPAHPHHLAIDLGEEAEVAGLTYLPRQDGRQEKGVIGSYEVYASRDGNDWGQPLATGRFEDIDQDPSGRVVTWAQPVLARAIKLVALDAPGAHPFAGAAEIGVLGSSAPKGP